MTFPRIIVDQELADGLGHAVGRLRSEFGAVGVRILHRCTTETGDAAGENHAGTSGHGTGRLENVASAIEIDPQRVVKPLFALAADHRCEMKNRSGAIGADHGKDRVPIAQIASHLLDARIGCSPREESIEEDDFPDRFGPAGGAGERAALEKFLGKLRAQKTASTGNDDFHGCFAGAWFAKRAGPMWNARLLN